MLAHINAALLTHSLWRGKQHSAWHFVCGSTECHALALACPGSRQCTSSVNTEDQATATAALITAAHEAGSSRRDSASGFQFAGATCVCSNMGSGRLPVLNSYVAGQWMLSAFPSLQGAVSDVKAAGL